MTLNHLKQHSRLVWKIVAAMILILIFFIIFSQAQTTTPQSPDTATTPSAETRRDNPLVGSFYVEPENNASRQAALWRTDRPEDAAAMDRLAALPSSKWVTDQPKIGTVEPYVKAAASQNKIPVLVTYFIPGRDCGLYSSGGAATAEGYKAYIDELAAQIGDYQALVILEPDAIAQISHSEAGSQPCLSEAQKSERLDLIRYAVTTLSKLSHSFVYIDAGNSGWRTSHDAVATNLTRSGIADANGFTVNVSNFHTLTEEENYGEMISREVGGKHFIIDTSRNGVGSYSNAKFPTHSWCNPPGRALGHYPSTNTDHSLVDAYMYIKNIGESDGSDPDPDKCFSGPAAGTWWPDYALGLVQRWPEHLQPSRR